MCGRYALISRADALANLIALQWLRFEMEPRWNIAPTQMAPVVREAEMAGGGREMAGLKWGLIPSWAKDPAIGSRMINARSETAASKPSFRRAMQRRRCVVPADGFYEWKKIGPKTKQPYYIHRADGAPMLLAGLWESWSSIPLKGASDLEAGESIETYTILTTEANEQMADLHDRMPVILEPEQVDDWMPPKVLPEMALEAEVARAVDLLRPAPAGILAMRPVSRRVNSPRNDDPALIEPVAEAVKDGDDGPGLFD